MKNLNMVLGFSGRMTRLPAWAVIIVMAILFAAFLFLMRDSLADLSARLLAYYDGAAFAFAGSDALLLLGAAVFYVVLAAVTVKRLHDRNKSGWWALLLVAGPIVATIAGSVWDPYVTGDVPRVHFADAVSTLLSVWWLIEVGFLKGTDGPNRFGVDPLRPDYDGGYRYPTAGWSGVGPLVFRGLNVWSIAVIGVLFAAAILVPLSVNSPSSPFYLSDSTTILAGRYLCYALLALSIGLIWGYGGILSLGHGAFFALGGYAMGMYLMRQIGPRGAYGNPVLPDFMVFLNFDALPWFWHGFSEFWFTLIWIFLAPGLLAFVFGWFAFRSRVTGVYLSIITQALTYALWLAFFRNDMGFGGNNGLTDFKDILGTNIQAPQTRAWLFAASAVALGIGYWICRAVVASKYGKVLIAVRDAESRTRFLGYRVDRYKLFVFTLSACMAGVAGALYVPQTGIINPGEFSPLKSIEIVVWVAVGGRGTLIGPILGGISVNALKSYFTGGQTWYQWYFAVIPAIGIAILTLSNLRQGLRQSPLLGAAAGAALAALVFVFQAIWPTEGVVMHNWAIFVAVAAILAWLIQSNRQFAAAALGATVIALLRNPSLEVTLSPYWTFVLGGLFVAVTMFLPRGIAGTITYGWNAWRARRESIRAQEGQDADLTEPEPHKIPPPDEAPPAAASPMVTPATEPAR